ncbi:MAG: HXXEE domain-containing protein [Gemmatimonadota bacterium]
MIVLGAAAVVALILARVRTPGSADQGAGGRAAGALAVAIPIQGLHFMEEAAAGFPARLGTALGSPAMPGWFFLAFNLTWLLIWIASVPAVRAGRRVGFFTAWFLAIAAGVNAIAHPVLAIRGGSYFPGLVTSPLVGVAGVWLGFRLLRATRRPAA